MREARWGKASGASRGHHRIMHLIPVGCHSLEYRTSSSSPSRPQRHGVLLAERVAAWAAAGNQGGGFVEPVETTKPKLKRPKDHDWCGCSWHPRPPAHLQTHACSPSSPSRLEPIVNLAQSPAHLLDRWALRRGGAPALGEQLREGCGPRLVERLGLGLGLVFRVGV